MDLWYIDNWSRWLDVKIVFIQTFGELFRGESEPIEDELNIERARRPRPSVREVPAGEWDALLAELGCATPTCCGPTSRRAVCSIPASPCRSSTTGRPGLHRARSPGQRRVRRDHAVRLRRACGPGGVREAYEAWCAERRVRHLRPLPPPLRELPHRAGRRTRIPRWAGGSRATCSPACTASTATPSARRRRRASPSTSPPRPTTCPRS